MNRTKIQWTDFTAERGEESTAPLSGWRMFRAGWWRSEDGRFDIIRDLPGVWALWQGSGNVYAVHQFGTYATLREAVAAAWALRE